MMDLQPDSSGAMIFHDPYGFYYFTDGQLTSLHSSTSIRGANDQAPYFHIDEDNALWYLEGDSCLVSERIAAVTPVTKIIRFQIGHYLMEGDEFTSPVRGGYAEKACVIDFFGYHPDFPSDRLSHSYRVIKNGRSAPWQKLSSSRLFYDQLKPGDYYIFEMRSKAPNGLYSRPAAVTLLMDPEPLYHREGFLAALAGFFIYRYYRIRTLLFRRRFNPYIAGEPVLDAALFFGREEVLDKILGIIHNNSVLVLGERRIGKTSLMKQLALHLEKRDLSYHFMPVYIDLQGVGQEEFFAAMMQDILDQISLARKELQLKIGIRHAPYTYRDFTMDLRTIITALKPKRKKRIKIVLLIDEADTMNDFDQSVHAQLRRIFMQDVSVHLAAVITGTHFIRTWNRPESPWWNLFTLVELSAISEESARQLIQQPVSSLFTYQKEAVDAIVKISRCKPYTIQMLCLHLIDRMLDQRRRLIHLEDVMQAIEDYPHLFQQEQSTEIQE